MWPATALLHRCDRVLLSREGAVRLHAPRSIRFSEAPGGGAPIKGLKGPRKRLPAGRLRQHGRRVQHGGLSRVLAVKIKAEAARQPSVYQMWHRQSNVLRERERGGRGYAVVAMLQSGRLSGENRASIAALAGLAARQGGPILR
jgi:hypothetical protein